MRRAASTADMFWVATFGSVAITLRTSVLMACGVPGMRSPKRRGPKAHRRRKPLQTAVRDRGASGRSRPPRTLDPDRAIARPARDRDQLVELHVQGRRVADLRGLD